MQGKDTRAAQALIDDAMMLEDAGAFAVVMECVPAQVAKIVTERLTVPTIGYGAGPHCDGQGMVSSDMLGMFDRFMPKFAKQYVDLGAQILQAFETYREEVFSGRFPTNEHSYHIAEADQHFKGRQDSSPPPPHFHGGFVGEAGIHRLSLDTETHACSARFESGSSSVVVHAFTPRNTAYRRLASPRERVAFRGRLPGLSRPLQKVPFGTTPSERFRSRIYPSMT